ncbi:hypothetical protein B0H13DRAFT_2537324 [Mycena leptocephala]|nr:hypothetical protein B0H13DRAFT_2537324 [Mycena leptocephala]
MLSPFIWTINEHMRIGKSSSCCKVAWIIRIVTIYSLTTFARQLRDHPPCSGVWRDVAPNVMTPQDVGAPLMKVRSGDRLAAKLIPLQPSHLPSPDLVGPPPPSGPGRASERPALGFPTLRESSSKFSEFIQFEERSPCTGCEGKLTAFKYVFNETDTNIYITADGNTSRWPGSMYLVYDD